MVKIGKSSSDQPETGPSSIGSPSGSPEAPTSVSEPTFGAFRDFVSHTETVITPYPLGFFNIEGGHLGIASQLLPSCSQCNGYSDEAVSFSCDACGRTPENYLHVRAGHGDGVYGAFELAWGDQFLGNICFTGSDVDLANRFHQAAQALTAGNENLEIFSDLFWQEFGAFPSDLQLDYFGTLHGVKDPTWNLDSGAGIGTYYFADVGEGENPRSAIVTSSNIPMGKQDVYLFSSREERNNNVLIPQVVLTLESSLAKSIGLPSGEWSVDVNQEAQAWANATVFSSIGGERASSVAAMNAALFYSMTGKGFFDEATEWDYQMKTLSWTALHDLLSENQIGDVASGVLNQLGPELAAKVLLMRGLKDAAADYYDFEAGRPGPLAENETTASQQPEGGSPARFCAQCGTEFVQEDAKFCASCGTARA